VTPRAGDLLNAAAAAAVAGVLGWGAWLLFAPEPRLDRAAVDALAAAERYDEAEAVVASYLATRPDDDAARFLAARMALAHPSPGDTEARRALHYLDKIRPDDPRKAALVALDRGQAEFYLARFDEAERSWKKALTLDPTVPEAAWGLLEMYYMQGRAAEARRLALKQFDIEPDPRDRVAYLMELAREDYQRVAPAVMVRWFEPRVRKNPGDLHGTLALGRGLVLFSRIDEGLALLRKAVAARPDDPDAWDALLSGLDDAGAPDEELSEALGRLPSHLASQPRFARHLARAAQEKPDWTEAARRYRRACEVDPGDSRLRYRLARALRNAGERAGAEKIERAYQDGLEASKALGLLYEEAKTDKAFGTHPAPDLYKRMADVRERMGLRGEAAAWHRLVLLDRPDDAQSRAAIERLTPP
jgi:tetratricopeptide (TPR) repeat protein